MDGFIFAVKEAFWSVAIKAEFAYGRVRRRIERKWVLRKKERTRWEDVWRYLDRISRRNWEDNHVKRLEVFSGKKHEAWVKKIECKYSVKL